MRSDGSRKGWEPRLFWWSLTVSCFWAGIAGTACSPSSGPQLAVDQGDAGASPPPTCVFPFSGRAGGACGPDVSNKGPCSPGVDQPCVNTCGPLKAGVKNCACLATGTWDCPVCEYDPDPALEYACYRRPPDTAASFCPRADTGSLIKSGDPCTQPACAACGSATMFSYLDSTNTMKNGFCVCSSPNPATPGKWSCASVKEWPPACLTDR